MEQEKSALVGITEIAQRYIPTTKKRVRRFVSLYLDVKRIGNRIYVDREQLEQLLGDPNRERFPLNV